MLQAQVDSLNSDAAQVPGGLIVLGSIHTEMAALLEDKQAPLFARITHEIELGHLDISSISAANSAKAILRKLIPAQIRSRRRGTEKLEMPNWHFKIAWRPSRIISPRLYRAWCHYGVQRPQESKGSRCEH
jgi:hypothetical protein